MLLQDANNCVRNLIASGHLAFNSVTLTNDPYGPFATGAVGDLSGDGSGASLSIPLAALKNTVTIPQPTALIAGVMNQSNLDSLKSSGPAIGIRIYCGTGASANPLAVNLTSTKWPTIFGSPDAQNSDAIVPLSSQQNGSGADAFYFPGYIHSDGTAKLGFGPPSITDNPSDPTKTVPNAVIQLLNTPINDAVFQRLNP